MKPEMGDIVIAGFSARGEPNFAIVWEIPKEKGVVIWKPFNNSFGIWKSTNLKVWIRLEGSLYARRDAAEVYLKLHE